MKTAAVRLSLAVLAFAAAVLPIRAEEWSKNYTISGKPDLRVETSDANIRVTAWDQNTIEAKVITARYKIGEGGIKIEERQTGDAVEIEVRFPHHNFNFEWGSGHRVDVIIQMPREGKVNLRTGDGRIEVSGLKGDMDLHTGDGSLNLDSVDGKLHEWSAVVRTSPRAFRTSPSVPRSRTQPSDSATRRPTSRGRW